MCAQIFNLYPARFTHIGLRQSTYACKFTNNICLSIRCIRQIELVIATDIADYIDGQGAGVVRKAAMARDIMEDS